LLRRAVTGMRRGQRLLYLATAAVYLSEAEWRCGNETAADRAAELAATVAGFQGSNHYLLSALSEFPDVVARRIDLEPTGESIWHDFGRTLLLHSTELPVVLGSAVALTEFGRLAVSADGREVNPGLSKSLELLALLANSDRREMTRDALLDALFDGKRDASTSAYLRQAVLRLRKALPDVLDADAPAGTVRLGPVRASTESRRLIGLLAEAAAQRDERRLELLQAALDLADRGTYLPAVASAWADERRQRIDELVRSARLEAGEVALSLGRYGLAAQLADQVVKADPYRESGWRLIMRVAALMGDQDRVLTTYRSCEQALAEVGGAPSESTAALVRDLRR
jgi:DNA-binding SARP family transcriptional activator